MSGRRALRTAGLAAAWWAAYVAAAHLAAHGRWADRALGEGSLACAAGLAGLLALHLGALLVWPGLVLVALARWARARGR